ncbi:MAG: Rrf2 family transcriptional regulator [Patescibacteria group bacterium]|nr:Rrf2 family transcriptional regulator [Patescibacteria group bacterium]
MKISRQEDYAITFVTALLNAPTGHYIRLSNVAKKYRLPEAYLRKIAHTLKTAGVVSVKEGRAGGYRLAMPARELTVGRVLGAFAPQVFTTECDSEDHSKHCTLYAICPSRLAWQNVTHKLTRDLYKMKFQEFVR